MRIQLAHSIFSVINGRQGMTGERLFWPYAIVLFDVSLLFGLNRAALTLESVCEPSSVWPRGGDVFIVVPIYYTEEALMQASCLGLGLLPGFSVGHACGLDLPFRLLPGIVSSFLLMVSTARSDSQGYHVISPDCFGC